MQEAFIGHADDANATTIPQPSATADMETFELKSYDVTNTIESACGCLFSLGIAGWTTKTLKLEADEAVLTMKNNCLNRTSKRPYAQLGSVDGEFDT